MLAVMHQINRDKLYYMMLVCPHKLVTLLIKFPKCSDEA